MPVADWLRELVTLLSSRNREDWGKANKLRDDHLPEHLYRYRPPTERDFAALVNGTIWLSAASKFNDLHDTSVVADTLQGIGPLLRTALTEGQFSLLPPEAIKRLEQSEDIVAALDAVFAESVGEQAGQEAAERAKNFFRDFAVQQSAKMSAQLTAFFQDKTKIGCFCETYDGPLLWAHYADSHRGFCIEYPVSRLPSDDIRRRALWPVLYTEEPFDVLAFAQRLAGGINVFGPRLAAMHKAPSWAYECEWRIIDQTGDPGPGREILMPTPSRIFLGSRMTADARDRIVQIAHAQGVALFEMTGDPRTHALQARAVES